MCDLESDRRFARDNNITILIDGVSFDGIQSKIDYCLYYLPDNKFLDSLNDFYEDYWYLSDKQLRCLDRIYDGVTA